MAVNNDSRPAQIYASNVKVEVIGSKSMAPALSYSEQGAVAKAKLSGVTGQMQVMSEFVDLNALDPAKFAEFTQQNKITALPVTIFRDIWSGEELGRATGAVSADVIEDMAQKVVAGQKPNVVVEEVAVDLNAK